jgi:hypothetical protein
LYGREGYHALFLKPLAELLGCRYVALEYLELHDAFLKGGGVFYVEGPWLWSRPIRAKWAEWMRRRMYPLLGNVHLFFTDGRYNSASEAPCGRVGLLAKRGEPLVTDLFLPLFLETGDVAKALRTAKTLFRCGLPKSRDELVEGVKLGKYVAGYVWSAWTPGLEVELRPYPALGKAVSGVLGPRGAGQRGAGLRLPPSVSRSRRSVPQVSRKCGLHQRPRLDGFRAQKPRASREVPLRRGGRGGSGQATGRHCNGVAELKALVIK